MITVTKHQRLARDRGHQSGVSLIELMVTIVVGLILLAGVSKIFLNSKQGYRVQESAGRLQENARFAVDALSRGVRNADFWAGVTPSAITKVDGSAVSTMTYANSGASTCKDGFIINPLDAVHGYAGAASLPGSLDCASNMSSIYVAQSDILALRYADPDQWYSSSAVCSASNNQGAIFLKASAGKKGLMYDKSSGTSCADAGTALPGEATTTGILNYRYAFQMFWLRKCSSLNGGTCSASSDGGSPIPSLVVTDLAATNTSDEVIAEGVEMMKIDYGVDSDGNGSVDQYYAAGSVADWTKVLTVRVGLIVRGDSLDSYTDTDTYNMPSGYQYTPPASMARYQRRLVVKELMVRNRVRRG